MNQAWDDEEADGAAGYIVCRACGTRIRANREACLRCGEPLEAAPETVSLATISSGRPLMIAVGIGIAVVALLIVFWINRPSLEEDATNAQTPARPAAAASATRPAAGRGAPAPSSVATVAAPPWAMEDLIDAPAATPDIPAGDLSAVRSQLERELQQTPNDVAALNRLAQVLEKVGDLPGAIAKYERAVEVSPNDWASHFNLARAFGHAAQWGSAVTEFRQALRVMPTDPPTQFNVAMAMHKTGNDAGAVAEYQAALRLAPQEPAFHLALANSLERAGQAAEAQQEFQQYLDLAPLAANAAAVRAHREALPSRPPGTP